MKPVEISVEADEQQTELTVLRVGPASQAASAFSGREVMVCPVGAKRGKPLWVRAEAGATNGQVAPATYQTLRDLQDADHKTDTFDLRGLTRRQRALRYGSPDVGIAVLALVVAAAAALKLLKDRVASDAADAVAIAGPLLIAGLGLWAAARRAGRPPWA